MILHDSENMPLKTNSFDAINAVVETLKLRKRIYGNTRVLNPMAYL
jgi:hypothetical protein